MHLEAVSLEQDRIEFEDGIAVRKLTPEERIWLIKQQMFARTDRYPHDVRAVVEYKTTQDKWESSLQLSIPAYEAAQAVIHADVNRKSSDNLRGVSRIVTRTGQYLRAALQ